MIPAPGVRFASIHSTNIADSGDQLSIWLLLTDGSLVGCYVPLDELIAAGNVIEETQHAPAGLRLQ